MKNIIVSLLCIVLSFSLIIGVVFGGNVFTSTDTGTLSETYESTADVPTWGMGSSWSYEQILWYNSTDEWIYLEEEFTYTVSTMEFIEFEGETHLCYNLTLEGEITEGEGRIESYNLVFEEGTIDGYMLRRVDDLAMIKDAQERYLDGHLRTFPRVGVKAWLEFERFFTPLVEDYDFPLDLDSSFWANSTMIIDGAYSYRALNGWFEDEGVFNEVESFEQESVIGSQLTELDTPAGTFPTYYLDNEVSQDGEVVGHVDQWYSPDAMYAVRDHTFLMFRMLEDEDTLTWFRELSGYHLEPAHGTIFVEPNVAKIGDTVTVTGHFPDHPNTDFDLFIGDLIDGVGEWTASTDGSGNFAVDIQVPHVRDNTPTLHDYSSSGIVAHAVGSPQVLAATTLTVLMDVQHIHLDPGWNFISFYPNTSVLNINTLEDILDRPDKGISGSYDMVMHFDASSGLWLTHVPGRPSHYNTLTDIHNTMGFWIKMNRADTLMVEGSTPSSWVITLYPGWNMVGIPATSSGNHGLPEEVSRIGYFDPMDEYNMCYTHETTDFVFQPGEGYWLFNGADSPVDWVVDH